MSGFLYFLPGMSTVNVAILERFGLMDRIESNAVTFRAVEGAGPSGTTGVIVASTPAADADGPAIGYYADRQQWHKAPQVTAGARPDYWLGLGTDHRPTPSDLQRAEMLGGHRVRLADGKEWLVPVARWMSGVVGLPRRLGLNDEGKLVGRVVTEYEPLLARAERVFEQFLRDVRAAAAAESGETTAEPESAEVDEPISEREAFDIAIEALAINYRIGPAEATVLELFTDRILGDVLAAFSDFTSFVAVAEARAEAMKKKAPAPTVVGSNT